jgi:uncharacterized protein (TIGR00730 family)
MKQLAITIFASSQPASAEHRQIAHDLGEAIAQAGHKLIFGGGRTGLMGDVCDACLAAEGDIHGIILGRFLEEGHQALRDKMEVHDNLWDRKRALVESADALIALPGGLGTLEELVEVLSLTQLGIISQPVVILDHSGFYDPLLAQIGRCAQAGFIHCPESCRWSVAHDAKQALATIEQAQ